MKTCHKIDVQSVELLIRANLIVTNTGSGTVEHVIRVFLETQGIVTNVETKHLNVNSVTILPDPTEIGRITSKLFI